MGKAKTKDLYAVIHITRKANWGENRQPYEDILSNFYGASSATELSYREKLDLIDRLKAIQEGKKMPDINRGPNGLWASLGQVEKIDALVDTLGWQQEGRLNGFIHRQTGKHKTKWMLTGGEATKVVVGLQRMIARSNTQLYNWLNRADAQLISSDQGQLKIKQLQN